MRSFITAVVGAVCILVATQPAPAQELRRRHVLQGHKKQVDAVAVSRDGTTVVSVANDVNTKDWQRWAEFRCWDVATGKPRASFTSKKGPIESVYALALSPDAKHGASVMQSGRVVLWSVADQREIHSHPLGGLHAAVAFSADGRKLGVATPYAILVCDGETGANATIVKRRGQPFGAAFSRDLRWLVRFFFQDVDFLNTTTGKLDHMLPDHPGTVSGMAFSADGKNVAVTVSTYDDNMNYISEIVVWDVEYAKRSAHLKGIGVCRYAGFAVDDRHLVLLTEPEFRSEAFELKVVEVPTGKASKGIRFQREQFPWCAAGSGDGRVIAVGCRDGSVQVFEVK